TRCRTARPALRVVTRNVRGSWRWWTAARARWAGAAVQTVGVVESAELATTSLVDGAMSEPNSGVAATTAATSARRARRGKGSPRGSGQRRPPRTRSCVPLIPQPRRATYPKAGIDKQAPRSDAVAAPVGEIHQPLRRDQVQRHGGG